MAEVLPIRCESVVWGVGAWESSAEDHGGSAGECEVGSPLTPRPRATPRANPTRPPLKSNFLAVSAFFDDFFVRFELVWPKRENHK